VAFDVRFISLVVEAKSEKVTMTLYWHFPGTVATTWAAMILYFCDAILIIGKY
jgi:hypothetical protein